jgi:hypothetical protein
VGLEVEEQRGETLWHRQRCMSGGWCLNIRWRWRSERASGRAWRVAASWRRAQRSESKERAALLV